MSIIELLASATEFFCGILFFTAFFSPRKISKWVKLGALLFSGVIHLYLSMYANNMPLHLRMAVVLGIWFLFCEICYYGHTWKKLLVLLLFWAFDFAIDISILALCTVVSNLSTYTILSTNACYLFSVLCSRSLLLSISCGCGYIIKRQEKSYKGKSNLWIFLLLVPLYTLLGTGIILSDTMQSGIISGRVVFLSGGLLCINVVICLVINRLEQNRQTEEEKLQLQSEVAHSLKLAETYQDSFKQQRKITHEFRNQLNVLERLLVQGDYERATKYVQHLINESHELPLLINTNHPLINAVLNQKYKLAVQNGIRMLVLCNDLSGIPMEDGDLVTILGNLLDNALASSAQTKEKCIWVHIWEEKGIYQLVIRNTCPETSVPYNEKETMMHGFGLQLVRTVFEKYGYAFYSEKNNDVYIFSAILD